MGKATTAPITLDWSYTGLKEDQTPNELQLDIAKYIGRKENIAVVAPTASGKTTAISILGKDKKKILYTGPTKALIEEKRRSWSNESHPFSARKMAVATSDYNKDASLQTALNEAELLLMTPESLLSRLRRITSSKSKFIQDVDFLVVDEIHGIGEKGRGGNVEAMLIEFLHHFPNVQVLVLSGTLPNVDEIVTWIEHLTNRTTILVESDYRPYPINLHFVSYTPGPAYETERERLRKTIDLILNKPEETFLVAVFKRAFGFKLLNELRIRGISVEFHYGQLSATARERIESLQKERLIQVVIATKTLFAGVNLDADNVIATDVYAGGQPADANELNQIKGRTGRFREGNAYFMVPMGKVGIEHIKRIKDGEPVKSTLTDPHLLATHLLGAVYTGRISQKIDCLIWYVNTLACRQITQNNVEESKKIINKVLVDMQMSGMLRFDEVFTLSQKGKIVVQLMLDPYWMSDLTRNFRKYLQLPRPTDVDLACAFGAVAPFYASYITDEDAGLVPYSIRKSTIKGFWKSASVYYMRLTKQDVPNRFKDINLAIWQDLSRCKEGLIRIGKESEQWENVDVLERAFVRVAKGVSWKEAETELIKLTKRERTMLNRIGLYSVKDIEQNKSLASTVLTGKRLTELGITNE